MSDPNDEINLFNNPKEPKPIELSDAIDTKFKLVPRGHGPFREKYRPHKIQEIAPTCSIELLRNQIDNPGASQIYLFEGESGTGKTSCARVLAKANVCLASNSLQKPCLKCDSCLNFDKSYDKTEINAADQNRIEDIRSLVDDMRYGPAVFKKKIYIFDEVQRLTSAAQQVLLTELEEPYPYLLIFLCTTDIKEINKALIDRSCRITFNKLSAGDARSIIKQVAQHERLEIPEDLYESLYLQAKGSIRALLNNIQAFSEKGYDPNVWLEDDVSPEVNTLYKFISKGDWPSLSKALARPEIRKEPETIRSGLENYMRAIVLRTPNLTEVQKLGNAMMRIQGPTYSLPATIQYNELVLKCLRACLVFNS